MSTTSTTVYNSLLKKDNSLLLRGVAIMVIMLHNFVHIDLFGFPRENEMSFVLERANIFFDAISDGKNLIVEVLSHLGWIGVPVFIFLTGFGVSLTPPPC